MSKVRNVIESLRKMGYDIRENYNTVEVSFKYTDGTNNTHSFPREDIDKEDFIAERIVAVMNEYIKTREHRMPNDKVNRFKQKFIDMGYKVNDIDGSIYISMKLKDGCEIKYGVHKMELEYANYNNMVESIVNKFVKYVKDETIFVGGR